MAHDEGPCVGGSPNNTVQQGVYRIRLTSTKPLSEILGRERTNRATGSLKRLAWWPRRVRKKKARRRIRFADGPVLSMAAAFRSHVRCARAATSYVCQISQTTSFHRALPGRLRSRSRPALPIPPTVARGNARLDSCRAGVGRPPVALPAHFWATHKPEAGSDTSDANKDTWSIQGPHLGMGGSDGRCAAVAVPVTVLFKGGCRLTQIVRMIFARGGLETDWQSPYSQSSVSERSVESSGT